MKRFHLLVTIMCLLITTEIGGQTNPGDFQSDETSTGDSTTAEEHYLGYEALADSAAILLNTLEAKGLLRQTQDSSASALIVCGKSDCRNLVRLRLLFELFDSRSAGLIARYKEMESGNELAAIIAKLESGAPDGELIAPRPGAAAPTEFSVSRSESIQGNLEAWTGVVGQVSTSVSEVARLVNSLTRTSVSVTSSEIDATNSHLSTAIAGQLINKGYGVYLPEYEQMENTDVTNTTSYKNYLELRRVVSEGEAKLAVINKLLDASNESSELSSVEMEKLVSFGNLVRSARELIVVVLTDQAEDDDPTNSTFIPLFLDLKRLENLIRAEQFSKAMRDGAKILSIDIIKVIGTRVEKRNVIMGVRNRFSGSATIQYVLTNSTGRVVYADTAVVHTGSRKLSTIRRNREKQ